MSWNQGRFRIGNRNRTCSRPYGGCGGGPSVLVWEGKFQTKGNYGFTTQYPQVRAYICLDLDTGDIYAEGMGAPPERFLGYMEDMNGNKPPRLMNFGEPLCCMGWNLDVDLRLFHGNPNNDDDENYNPRDGSQDEILRINVPNGKVQEIDQHEKILREYIIHWEVKNVAKQ